MRISRFAERQLRERCGLNKKSMQRMTERAFKQGIRYRDTKGRLYKWVSNLYYNYPRNGNDIRIYGDKAFVFCKDTLVTIVQIPHYLTKDLPAMYEKGVRYEQ